MSAEMFEAGVVGMGAMGMNLAFLLADKGISCLGYNRKEDGERAHDANEFAKLQNVKNFRATIDLEDFMTHLKSPKKILLSIAHDKVIDMVIDQIMPFLEAKDLIIDCGNEWFEETERRIGSLAVRDILFLGMGVSGGYQSARVGPSMSPGGTREAFESARDILVKVSPVVRGKPIFAYIGTGGSGHHVKMVHNGIEQGMMGAIADIYGVMRDTLKMKNEDMRTFVDRWAKSTEFHRNFLLDITTEILTYPDTKLKDGTSFLLDFIMDNVTQDADNGEGTGVWTVRDAAARHMPASTISAAHFFRIKSAYRNDRVDGSKLFNPREFLVEHQTPSENIDEDLRLALYLATWVSFIEGFNLIVRASNDNKWNLNMRDIVQIYRGGCIIQSDYILDVLDKVYAKNEKPITNLFLDEDVINELKKGLLALRRVVMMGVGSGSAVGTLAAALSVIDTSYNKKMTTNMEQAQLDYFGLHRYDREDEPLPREKEIKQGTYHTEWKHPLRK